MKNNFKRCLALLLALMTIVGAFSIPVSAAEECDHDWELKSTKVPTCEAQGYETWFCKICQEYEVRNITDKLNHNWVKSTAEVKPTCSKDGYPKGVDVCSKCNTPKDPVGAEYKADKTLPDFSTMTNPEDWKPTDDKFHKWVNPTPSSDACVSATYEIKWTCEHCEKTIKQPQTGKGEHTYEYTTTKPTCAAEGSTVRKCKVCGDTTTIKIEKIAHTPAGDVKWKNVKIDADNDAHYSYQLCSMCNGEVKLTSNEKHNYGSVTTVYSTCSVQGTDTKVCTTCGYKNVTKRALVAHTYNPAEVVATVAGSHTVTGVVHGYKVYHCTVCNQDFKKYDDEANFKKYGDDHYWEKTTKVDSTCTAAGIQGWACTVCNTTKHTSIAADHKFPDAWNTTKYPATCTTDGYQVKICTLCAYEKKGEKLPSKGNGAHAESVVSTDTAKGYKAATCFATGVDIEVCKECGTVTKKTTSPKKDGHIAGTPVVTGSGCYDDKISTTTCDKGCVKVEVLIPKQSAHVTGDIVTLKPATCFEEGVLGYVCSRCGMKTEVDKIEFAIDNHVGEQVYSSSIAGNVNTDPASNGVWPQGEYSCEQETYEWMYCNSCHRNYRRLVTVVNTVTGTGTGDNKEIYYDGKYRGDSFDIKSVSSSHTLYIDVVTMPTCYTEGKGTEKCANPNCTYEVKNITLGVLPHTPGAKTSSDVNFTASTCYQQAPWVIKCTVCTRTIETGYYDLANHVLDTGTVKTPATCVGTGVMEFKCTASGCTHKETKEIEIAKHTKSETLAPVPATCTTDGLKLAYKCKVTGCGVIFTEASDGKQTVVPAQPVDPKKNHTTFDKAFDKDGNFVGVTGAVIPNTCTKNGYTQILCANGCGVEIGWVDYVAPKGHSNTDKTKYTQEATCATYEYTYILCANGCGTQLEIKENTAKPKKAHVNADGDTLTGDCRLKLEDVKCKVCGDPFPPKHVNNPEKFAECKVTKNTCTVCGEVEWVNDKDVKDPTHTFVVNNDKSVAATITTEGKKVEDCVVCGYEKSTKVGVLSAVTFSMKAYNPNGGNIVNGGLVYVDVNMKTAQAIDVNNIRVAFEFDKDDLIFVGVVGNESVFGNISSEPVANDNGNIVYAFDDAGKERFNITLDGEMKFMTLAFYVRPTAVGKSGAGKDRLESILKFVTGKDDFTASVSYYNAEKNTYSGYTFDITTNEKIDLAVDQLGDINNDGKINNYDLVAVRDAMAEGTAYDAVLDIDHDGEITIKDYKLIKEYMVAKYEYWQFADIDSFNSFVEYAGEKNITVNDTNYKTWLETAKA